MSLIESFLGFSWFFVDDIAMIMPILNLVDDVDHVFQLLIRRCPTKRAHHLIQKLQPGHLNLWIGNPKDKLDSS